MLRDLIRPVYHNLVRPVTDRIIQFEWVRTRCHQTALRGQFLRWCRAHPARFSIDGGYERRLELHDYVVESEHLTGPILYLEFGVYRGESLQWWLSHNEHADSRFIGFDSFEGLPENWHEGRQQGHFTTRGEPPALDDQRCGFEIGWFQETVPKFLQSARFENRLVLHLDADLYSSTLFVLLALAPQIKPGDILIFDEFGDVLHEFRAFVDFLSAYPLEFEVLGVIGCYGKIAVKIQSVFDR